ncbi:MAG: ATP-dependent helicase HepA [Gammaproteobacteria bacterium]|jgi:ATP-dependent helicase HepA
MNNYIPGQRWISDAESRMGLGTVLSSEDRTVKISFPATGEFRLYAKHAAPLTRIIFNIGDEIATEEGVTIIVDSIIDNEGLILYQGNNAKGDQLTISEDNLANTVQLNRPAERLFNGQTDSDKWFQARFQTINQLNRLAHNNLYGLAGSRTSLIPHQLYIANEVAHRHAPRVLLADEVGLGKTIEAGMIIHHQILTERSKRILIVVPESLVHQWLVEMLRKFNLTFSIFDAERCYALEESNDEINIFQTEQLIICSIEFLTEHENYYQQSLLGEWDLLVVDEVHHLYWSTNDVSTEYEIIEQLSHSTRGVLLLTATPEQLGKESHYARLRLLDPNRFPDFKSFVEEEKNYEPIAVAVEELFSNTQLPKKTMELLSKLLADTCTKLLEIIDKTELLSQENIEARNKVIDQLLDYHGTGRVLFRNTRNTIKGFPDRELFAYPLTSPQEYLSVYGESENKHTEGEIKLLLCPEILYQQDGNTNWVKIDPRISWLIDKLKLLKEEKVLVICAHASSAIDISKILRKKEGMHVAAFHEGLSLVERDRAAAYFANEDEGSQVLICSEIGSEGRNFQFAHHLILFDLPLNPDLLEQRIGRLDRIGQRQTIKIHVPYLENIPQAIMFNWYQQGLEAFSVTCPAGQAVFEQVESELKQNLITNKISDALIAKTNKLHMQLNEAMHKGRDRLLEYGSCRPAIAEALKNTAIMEDNNNTLPEYMELIFDCFGINSEFHSESTYILNPGERMLSAFPGLTEDGMTITYSRETALIHEDMQYLSWEHPLVSFAMDMVMSSELGNATVCTLKQEEINPGTLLMEALFVLEPIDKLDMQSSRFLPPTTIRIILDEQGNSLNIESSTINENQDRVASEIIKEIINMKADVIRILLEKSRHLADEQVPKLKQLAAERTNDILQVEVDRLLHMRKVNSNIRLEEIEYCENQLNITSELITSASIRLDALRIIIAV